jgi:hypothetical protein
MFSTDPHFDITSLGLTLYNDKIPSVVAQAMHALTQSTVVLVPMHKEAIIGAGRRTDSHLNVKHRVEKHGGKLVSGWSLDRNKKQINDGIFRWTFHSNWLSPENQLVNITIDTKQKFSEKHTFWHDAQRAPDVVEGFAYNDLFITTNRIAAEKFKVQIGRLYWFASGLFKPIEESDGKCYWLTDDYRGNFDRLEKEHGVRLFKTEKGYMPTEKSVPDLENDKRTADMLFRFYMQTN